MEVRSKNDDRKIIAALVSLFIGFAFVWNIATGITDIYELKLGTETCEQVKTLGYVPSSNCIIVAPYRTLGLGAVGYLMLPDRSFIQISPLAANRTNKSADWTTSMKAQFWIAILFWAATLALLLSAFRGEK